MLNYNLPDNHLRKIYHHFHFFRMVFQLHRAVKKNYQRSSLVAQWAKDLVLSLLQLAVAAEAPIQSLTRKLLHIMDEAKTNTQTKKTPKLGHLQQQKFILSQFWGPEVQNRGFSRSSSFWGVRGRCLCFSLAQFQSLLPPSHVCVFSGFFLLLLSGYQTNRLRAHPPPV